MRISYRILEQSAPNQAVGEEETTVPAVELGTAPPGESGGDSSGENNGGGG